MTARPLRLRAICFDLWETLYLDDPDRAERRRRGRRDLVAQAFHRAGLRAGRDVVEAAFDGADRDAASVWAEHWRSTPAIDRIRRASLDLGVELAPATLRDLAAAVEDLGLRDRPTLAPDAREIVEALAARHRLAVLSDTGQTPARVLRDWLRRDGVLESFAVTTFSDEVGETKPGARGFMRTARELGVAASEMLHIGDNAGTDVAGALGCGMRCLHLSAAGSPEHALDPRYRQISRLRDALPLAESWP